jgi:hypothetical protein
MGAGIQTTKYFVASMIGGMLLNNLIKRDRKIEIKSN